MGDNLPDKLFECAAEVIVVEDKQLLVHIKVKAFLLFEDLELGSEIKCVPKHPASTVAETPSKI